MEDVQMQGVEQSPSLVNLPSKPVLEMALDLSLFKREVQNTLSRGQSADIEYVMLKVAMEVQDKANMLNMLQQQSYRPRTVQEVEQAAKMQRLRYQRFSSVFKACHELGFLHVDMYRVFYEPSVNLFVGPHLRRDLIECCYGDYLKQPSLIATKVKSGDLRAAILCYVVILEANDDPFTVQDRFEKRVIDVVFDATRVYLIGSQQGGITDQKRNSTSQEIEISSEGGTIWARIAYQLAKYFSAIQ
mmetsp:Transcript_67/g.123  ORF Transcript_67/g.123 Transcript_67/m.123 type:complete len:245 (+) Transcript_67:84-818(+)|eukprot:CAMPEP_0185570000 /NCGR_PEP_ID=MMETSP0434-20130131/2452_1 /TAXON_ID=626734 ORGANISM="Favella taraikaensis, Strain Fe Narragansett Bay" /NCGR_SAMPLE_ID=MMETSP0434 /ASSEMBLY_ACC=CAM_ASM_000379 /LENGTH=244 /DNA_ID=CAMNT_0028184983 /DNA_START=82 /DNA_END=816 /DNA_ORIENTATION=+